MARNLDGFAQLARMSAKAQTDNTLFDEIDAVYDRMVEAGERFMETGRDDDNLSYEKLQIVHRVLGDELEARGMMDADAR